MGKPDRQIAGVGQLDPVSAIHVPGGRKRGLRSDLARPRPLVGQTLVVPETFSVDGPKPASQANCAPRMTWQVSEGSEGRGYG